MPMECEAMLLPAQNRRQCCGAASDHALVKLECEPAPLILGYVLGPLKEEYLRRAKRPCQPRGLSKCHYDGSIPPPSPCVGTDTLELGDRLMGACACRYARLFPNFPLEGLDFNDYYVETSHAPLVRGDSEF